MQLFLRQQQQQPLLQLLLKHRIWQHLMSHKPYFFRCDSQRDCTCALTTGRMRQEYSRSHMDHSCACLPRVCQQMSRLAAGLWVGRLRKGRVVEAAEGQTPRCRFSRRVAHLVASAQRVGGSSGTCRSSAGRCSSVVVVAATLMAETWTYASQGYLPGQLYNLNSKFGNQEELKELVAACKEAGVRPVCELCMLEAFMVPPVVLGCQAAHEALRSGSASDLSCCNRGSLTRGSFAQATSSSTIGVRTPRTSTASGTSSGE